MAGITFKGFNLKKQRMVTVTNGRKVKLKNGAQALRGSNMGTTVFKIIKGASKGKKPRRKRRWFSTKSEITNHSLFLIVGRTLTMRNSFLILAILGIVAIFPQYAFGQVGDTLMQPNVGILPDSPFYNFKLFFENLQEAFTLNQERRAEIILEHAELRRAEVDILEFRMIPIPERVIEIHDEKIAKAVEIIERLEADLPPQTSPSIESIAIDRSEFAPTDIRVLQKIDEEDDEQTIVDKLRDRLTLAFSDSQIIEIKSNILV